MELPFPFTWRGKLVVGKTAAGAITVEQAMTRMVAAAENEDAWTILYDENSIDLNGRFRFFDPPWRRARSSYRAHISVVHGPQGPEVRYKLDFRRGLLISALALACGFGIPAVIGVAFHLWMPLVVCAFVIVVLLVCGSDFRAFLTRALETAPTAPRTTFWNAPIR